MHDSLLSRFRGAFLGVLLGEMVGVHSLPPQHSRWTGQKFFQGQFGKGWGRAARSNHAVRLMLAQTAALIGSEEHSARSSEPESSNDLRELASVEYPENWTSAPIDRAGEMMLATLPLALFYHDQPLRYRMALQAINRPAANRLTNEAMSASTLAATTVIGQAVSLILRERFTQFELIPQVVKDLDLWDSSPELAQDLMQMQGWLEQRSALANVVRHAKQMATRSTANPASLVAVSALYSFLSTPDDFRLSLLRSTQLHSSILLPTLTGAISGLYNGISGLPVFWRQQVWTGEVAELNQRWGIASEAEVEHFADRLLACWSGANDPMAWLQQPQFNRITAAPRAIRPD
ncbi:MAG: hypothetical protein HC827_00690 [Cyanobacteria bacterium RM1_2_2]|nr:hypothetical protein [Cyanobacteria bacterium RM1_2_2]